MSNNDAGKGSKDNRTPNYEKRAEILDKVFGERDASYYQRDKLTKKEEKDGR